MRKAAAVTGLMAIFLFAAALAVAVGQDFEVLGVQSKSSQDESGSFSDFSVKVLIKNKGAYGDFTSEVVFLDSDGFEVDSTYVSGPLGQGETGSITGRHRMSSGAASRVKSMKVRSTRRR